MRVVTTPRELMDLDLWREACDATGLNPWAVNEGMPDDDPVVLTGSQAKDIGLLTRVPSGAE